MPEIWDAYDKNSNVIKGVQLVRGEPVPDGMYHLVCDVIVKHVDGTYLLMQRDLNKTHGGKWELTAGGSALAGETSLDGAMRELREETGIVSDNFRLLESFVNEQYHFIGTVYLCLTDCDKASIVLQEGETISYKWAEKSEILNMPDDSTISSRATKILRETEI